MTAKSEVLRYLGHRQQEISPQIDAMVNECMILVRKTAAARHARMKLPVLDCGGEISLGDALNLGGRAIRRHLAGCESAVLTAATLGVEIDGLIRRYEQSDLTRALLLDACATQLIEEYCDGIESDVRREAAVDGLSATGRFSPGYGDLELGVQPKILAVLDSARKIGLTCTQNLIMLPRKSVTAIIGVGKDVKSAKSDCGSCDLKDTCTAKRC